MSEHRVGRLLSTGAIVEARFDRVLEGVDDLVLPPATAPLLAPGFIDLQVNGFAGVDYNNPAITSDELARSIRRQFATGVTRLLPTVITGSTERMCGALANLARAKCTLLEAGRAEGEAIAGYHVEGPHISPEDGPRGAHPLAHVRPPDLDEFSRMQEAARDEIKLVTISPEWPQAPAFIETLVRQGVVVSIGHTRATGQQISEAVAAGATMSTHLGNGAHSVLPKTDNYLWEQLADERLSASFILDGIHIPGAFARAAIRAKGTDRAVLITDAVMPATCPPGPYRLGEVAVELHPGNKVTLAGETRLAGSALCLDLAVANGVRLAGTSLREAVAMASVNAARAARIAGRQRGITPGDKADLVLFSWSEETQKITLEETILAGRTVYTRQH